jgi:MFS family permease
MLTIRLDFKSPAPGVVKDMFKVLRNVELFALLLSCFLLGKTYIRNTTNTSQENTFIGTVWGYLESFLFWLLQDLGASRTLMGLTITVGGLAGLPLLALSGPIIEKVGHANIICLGFLFYGVRLIGKNL